MSIINMPDLLGNRSALSLIANRKSNERIMLKTLANNSGKSKTLQYSIGSMITIINVYNKPFNAEIIDGWIENGWEKYLVQYGKTKLTVRLKDIQGYIKQTKE